MSITNEKIIDFLNEKYKPLDDEIASFRLENEKDGVPLILRETEGFLNVLLDILKPKNILEIGTAYGYSSIFFARKIPDAMVTNFHLPLSPMLMISCAFGGYELVMKAYDEALKADYRFGAYGDAMLIM